MVIKRRGYLLLVQTFRWGHTAQSETANLILITAFLRLASSTTFGRSAQAGHARQGGVDSRCNGSGDWDLGSDGSDAFRMTAGTFDGAATAIAAVKSGAFGAPLRGCGT